MDMKATILSSIRRHGASAIALASAVVLAASANAFAAPNSPKFENGEFYANPLLDHHFCADPTAVEYEGRLFVYGTNDHQQYDESPVKTNNTYECIKTLSVMSTADMANWTYHGEINVGEIAPWIVNSWAPSVVSRKEKDGKTHFYMYFSNSGCGTGVLTATHPLGPWTSPLEKSLVDQQSTNTKKCKVPFDPGAAIAPDGTGYLAFGGAESRLVKLGPDMISVVGEATIPPAPFHFEANELNFIGDTCVYTYNIDWSDHEPWPCDCAKPIGCSMVYETSKTPLDETSWKMRGEYNQNPGMFGNMFCNNHTHLHKYKGKWYLIYHNQELQKSLLEQPGGFRNINIDVCEVDEKTVTLNPVKNTRKGVEQIQKLNPRRKVQAETAAATAAISFAPLKEPGNMAAKPKEDGAWIAVRGADFGAKSPAKFTFSARGKGKIEVRLDRPDGSLVASGHVKSPDTFKTASLPAKAKATGEHAVFVLLSGSVELDWWTFGK